MSRACCICQKFQEELLNIENNYEKLEVYCFLANETIKDENVAICNDCNQLVEKITKVKIANKTAKTKKQKEASGLLLRQRYGMELILEILKEDEEWFLQVMRMPIKAFLSLVEKLGKETFKDSSFSTEHRVALFLMYTGGVQKLAVLRLFTFATIKHTMSLILSIKDLILNKRHEFIKLPKTEDEWLHVAQDIFEQFNIPNCVGMIDSKDLFIMGRFGKPNVFYSGKSSANAIKLQLLVNAKREIMHVAVGCPGSNHDKRMLEESALMYYLKTNSLNLPKGALLREPKYNIPFFFLVDLGYSFGTHFMRKFPKPKTEKQLKFNQRFKRARYQVEYTFADLVNEFPIMDSKLNISNENMVDIFESVCCLHNWKLSQKNLHENCTKKYVFEFKDNLDIMDDWPRVQCMLADDFCSDNSY